MPKKRDLRPPDDSESSDLEYIPSECLNKEFYRKHGGPGTALERIYNMLFDEDLESHEIRRLQREAMEQHKQKQFQMDFNAALERERQISEMPLTLGTLKLFKNYLLAVSLDILCLLILISWYFGSWRILFTGLVVHFVFTHFRILKFFTWKSLKRNWNFLVYYPNEVKNEYETPEEVFLRYYDTECYRSTLMKTFQRKQDRIQRELKSQMSFMEKQLEKKNEEIENLKVSVDVENIYAEECECMRKKLGSLEIERAILKTENTKLQSQMKEKTNLINEKKSRIESMESNQKQHSKELKSLKSKMDDVKFANSKMTKDLSKSEKTITNMEFEIKQLKKKLENHQKTKPPKPKKPEKIKIKNLTPAKPGMLPECVICSDTAMNHDPVALPCGHVFGALCINSWFQKKESCPICNTFASDETVKTLYFAYS